MARVLGRWMLVSLAPAKLGVLMVVTPSGMVTVVTPGLLYSLLPPTAVTVKCVSVPSSTVLGMMRLPVAVVDRKHRVKSAAETTL